MSQLRQPNLLVFKQLSVSSLMPRYYLWTRWKCDNVLATITTNKGDGFFDVLTFFHVWLRGTLDLSHFRDEQDWDGSTVIRGLGTINSIQLVLISTMDRTRKKQQPHRVLQQWNELLMSESLSNPAALNVENIKSRHRKTYDWNELYRYLKGKKSLLASDQIMITGWQLFDDIQCYTLRWHLSAVRYFHLFLTIAFEWETLVAPNSIDSQLIEVNI